MVQVKGDLRKAVMDFFPKIDFIEDYVYEIGKESVHLMCRESGMMLMFGNSWDIEGINTFQELRFKEACSEQGSTSHPYATKENWFPVFNFTEDNFLHDLNKLLTYLIEYHGGFADCYIGGESHE